MDGTSRFLICGPGGVGLGIGSCLLRDGQQVCFLGRPGTIEALKRNGLRRTGIFGEFRAGPDTYACTADPAEIPAASVDFVLICTKSYDSPAVASELAAHRRLLKETSILILLQNGWGTADAFTPHFKPDSIYHARVITGFEKPGPSAVRITVHADDILLGSIHAGSLACLEPVGASIRRGGIPCRVTPHIAKDLWAKMLYNCTLNPLGALLDLPYGELANLPSCRRLMDWIVNEVYDVMVQQGYTTHWPEPDGFLDAFYQVLVPRTAAHESSMLQDLRSGKRTEIDVLNGAVARLAAQGDVAAPYNACVADLVKSAESVRGFG